MIVALLLAAGESRRMGQPKLQLELGGDTLLQRSLRNLLDAPVDRVRVIVPPAFEDTLSREDDRVELVTNPDRDEGIASSIRAGLAGLPNETRVVLIVLADQPLVKPETIRLLVETFESHRARVVFPVHEGQQGHPVLWDAKLVSELAALRGDRGAKSLIERHRHEALEVEVHDPGVCFDIDTPADYDRARESNR